LSFEFTKPLIFTVKYSEFLLKKGIYKSIWPKYGLGFSFDGMELMDPKTELVLFGPF